MAILNGDGNPSSITITITTMRLTKLTCQAQDSATNQNDECSIG
jgi:hypothetical protein